MDKRKWNVFFTIQGVAVDRTIEAPNATNPVPCANLASLLAMLAKNLPGGTMGVETIGIRVELHRA